jgi:hypothetical protein
MTHPRFCHSCHFSSSSCCCYDRYYENLLVFTDSIKYRANVCLRIFFVCACMHVLQIPSGFAPKDNTFDVDKRVKTIAPRFSGEREELERGAGFCTFACVCKISLSLSLSPPPTLARLLACYSLMHMCCLFVCVSASHKEITCFSGSMMFVHIMPIDSTHTCVRML